MFCFTFTADSELIAKGGETSSVKAFKVLGYDLNIIYLREDHIQVFHKLVLIVCNLRTSHDSEKIWKIVICVKPVPDSVWIHY